MMGCINALSADKNELAKNSIYLFEGNEEFEEVLRKGADYEFAVICANSGIKFIEGLKAVFKGEKFDKDEIVKNIERLPGRIIIVGTPPKNWTSPSDNFQRWLTKRICWVNDIDIDNFNLKEDGKPINLDGLSSEEQFKLKLYEIWVEHVRDQIIGAVDYKIKLKFYYPHVKSFHAIFSLKERVKELTDIIFMELTRKRNRELKNKSKFKDWDFKRIYSYLYKVILFSSLAVLNNLREDDIKKLFPFLDQCLERLSEEEIKLIMNKLKKGTYKVNSERGFLNKVKKIIIEILRIDSLDLALGDLPETTLFLHLNSPLEEFKVTSAQNLIACLGNNSHQISILYHRHASMRPQKAKVNNLISFGSDKYYGESLSASSSHFSIISSNLSSNGERKYKTIYSLMENGLLRILVADERVARFVGQNPTAKENLSVSGVDVVKSLDGLPLGKSTEVNIGEFAPGDVETFESLKLDKENLILKGVYHILIIHQGILDKIASEKPELSSPERMEEVIQFWKENFFPYVIVTSGRGTPANVPLNAKFVPFSIIETTLMKQYHEKYILIKILMKSLPARREG